MKKRFLAAATAMVLSFAACASAEEYAPPETKEWKVNGEKIMLTLEEISDLSPGVSANGVVYQTSYPSYNSETGERYTFIDDVFCIYHGISSYQAVPCTEEQCAAVTEQFLTDAGIDFSDYELVQAEEYSGKHGSFTEYQYDALDTDAAYGNFLANYSEDGILTKVILHPMYPADVKPPAGDVAYFERELKKHLKKIDYADYQILDQTVRYGRRGKFLLAIYEITFWDGAKTKYETLYFARKKLF